MMHLFPKNRNLNSLRAVAEGKGWVRVGDGSGWDLCHRVCKTVVRGQKKCKRMTRVVYVPKMSPK